MRCEINKVKEQVPLQDSTKTENTVGHDKVNHQVLEEGIDNMFTMVESPFVDEERKEGSWSLDFDGACWNKGILRVQCFNNAQTKS